MAAYIAQCVINGAYTYDFVISRRPDLKAGIDAYLTEHGQASLITNTGTQQDQTAR